MDIRRIIGKGDRFAQRCLCRLRLLRLRLCGADIGPGTRVFGRVFTIGDQARLRLGRDCTLNEGVIFNLHDRVDIGDEVHVSAQVQFHTGKLDLATRTHTGAPIVIGNRVWLAAGVVVAAGVTIGDGAVIGANSVVLEAVPAGALAAGCPAMIIRQLA